MKIKQTHGNVRIVESYYFNKDSCLTTFSCSKSRLVVVARFSISSFRMKSDERTLEVEGKEKVIDSQICKFHAKLLIDIRRVRQRGGKWRNEGEDSLSRILRECKGKKGTVTNVLPRRVSGFAEGIGFSNGVNRKFTRESWLSIPRGGTNVCPARQTVFHALCIRLYSVEKLKNWRYISPRSNVSHGRVIKTRKTGETPWKFYIKLDFRIRSNSSFLLPPEISKRFNR